MRLAFSILALLAYLVSFNTYVLNLPNPDYLPEIKKLWYSYTTASILLYYTVDSWHGYSTWLREMVGRFTIICVICNFLLIILTHHGVINEPILQIVVYNCLWVIICISLFVSAWRNGLFKNT